MNIYHLHRKVKEQTLTESSRFGKTFDFVPFGEAPTGRRQLIPIYLCDKNEGDDFMQEKLKKIKDYFSQNDVNLPIDVNNALEDVFNENDEIEDGEVYFKEDAELFEDDLILANELNVDYKGPSKGSINNVFTYYGEVDFSLSEFVSLVDGDKVIEEITRIDQLDRPSQLNAEMFAIVLIEKVSWQDGELERVPHLYIYCPYDAKEGE